MSVDDEIEDDSLTEAEVVLFDKIMLMAYQEEKRSRTELRKVAEFSEPVSTKECVEQALRAVNLILNARRERIGRK